MGDDEPAGIPGEGFRHRRRSAQEPGGWDYFDELLARIREIRCSEKRFYQKVRDLFALSADYQDDEEAAQTFFAEVQNKMLYAVTRHTAAELVVKRADARQPNMALQAFSGTRVRKHDVIVAKNYLDEREVDELDRIVTLFLEFAEDRARRHLRLAIADWQQYVDKFMAFNERPLLKGNGAIRHEQMVKHAHERYEEFDAKRRKSEAIKADADDMAELAAVEKIRHEGGTDAA